MAPDETKETTLNFIEDYKSFPVLWNVETKQYHNKKLRKSALKKLSEDYNISVVAVKNKIKSLRSYFCKEHQKTLKSKDDSKAQYVSSWYAYNDLLFLADIGTLKCTQHMGVWLPGHDEESQNDILDDTDQLEDSEDTSIASTSFVTEELTNPFKRKRPYIPTEQEIIPNAQNAKPDDEYSVFGQWIAHKIRKLNTPRLRSIAQNQISNSLHELEISEENEKAASLNSSLNTILLLE